MKSINAGVLGCTGIVGQQFVRLLDGHPFFKLSVLAASARSAGKIYGDAHAWVVDGELSEIHRSLPVIEAEAESLVKSGTRVFFSALPASAAGPLEDELRKRGCFVFSNASAHRMDQDVPILVPEVNPEHLELAEKQLVRHGGFIVAGPNCSTSGLVLTLKPLDDFGLDRVSVTTFQSISGAGRRGLPALDIAGNVIPLIRDEEEKMDRETRKILGFLDGESVRDRSLDVRASCCRVPVRDGHLLSLEVEFSKRPDPEEFIRTIADFRGVPRDLALPTAPEQPLIMRAEEDRPQPALDVLAGRPERARGMAVTLGRLRFKDRTVNLFALVHNTIRGAAGTCLLNAELAARKGLVS